MILYGLPIKKPTAVYKSVCGNFSGGSASKNQEVVTSKGQVLDFYEADSASGKLIYKKSFDMFCVVRSMEAFRLSGTNRDFLLIGSDSGSFTVLKFFYDKNVVFVETVQNEVFGRTGCRRTVPGDFLAVDAKGRAVMISAIEKSKFVYILNRDADMNLTISSPLEAHKSNFITVDSIGLDVDFDNPIFCNIEISLDNNNFFLTLYELDLSLNHVVRKFSINIPYPANKLFAVPKQKKLTDESILNGGVLVCCENYIIYKSFNNLFEESYDLIAPLPQRKNNLDNPERSVLIVAGAVHQSKSSFYLLHTDQGDILRVVFKSENALEVEYFCTLPSVANSLCIMRSGFLFCSYDQHSHQFFQIVKISLEGEKIFEKFKLPFGDSSLMDEQHFYNFDSCKNVKTLLLTDEIFHGAVIDSKCCDLGQGYPQFYMCSGSGKSSKFVRYKYGLQLNEIATTELPGFPKGVFSLNCANNNVDGGGYHNLLVIALSDSTLSLLVSDTVEETDEFGISSDVCTLFCGVMDNNKQTNNKYKSIVQVHSQSIRHIHYKKETTVNEWKCPHNKQILLCAGNARQLVVALAGDEIVYFELNSDGSLNEYGERKIMPANIICLNVGPIVNEFDLRSNFMAVSLQDSTIRILSLDCKNTLNVLWLQALPSNCNSLLITGVSSCNKSTLVLHMGLVNGVLLKTDIDGVTGKLSNVRSKYLGAAPIKLFNLANFEQYTNFCVSKQIYVNYVVKIDNSCRDTLVPFSYDENYENEDENENEENSNIFESFQGGKVVSAAGFCTEQCPENGMVVLTQNAMCIMQIENLNLQFKTDTVDLSFTPRSVIYESKSNDFVVLQSQNNTFTKTELHEIKDSLTHELKEYAEEIGEQNDEIEHFEKLDIDDLIVNAGDASWASCISVVDSKRISVIDEYFFDKDYTALCHCICDLGYNEVYLVVGLGRKISFASGFKSLYSSSKNSGAIHVFKINLYKTKRNKLKIKELVLHHETETDLPVTAVAHFKFDINNQNFERNKVIVGLSNGYIRLYQFGKKKMLKKCEYRQSNLSLITNIYISHLRVIVVDIVDSLQFLRYKFGENTFVVYADDTYPRSITKFCELDYDTFFLADKFGNVSVVRLEGDIKEDIDEDPTGVKSLWDKGNLNGAPQKLTTLANYYLGETVTSVCKVSLTPSGAECISVTTLSNGIFIFCPITSKDDAQFLQLLEMFMKEESSVFPTKRIHSNFRSSYFPVKNVIDGSLCEKFTNLEESRRIEIAEQMDHSVEQLTKRLEDIRSKFTF